MAIRSLGPPLSMEIAAISTGAGGGAVEIDAEPYSENVTAPAIGATATLSASPLVEGNLTLAGPDGTVYENGVHYVEVIQPAGFENLTIPAGTVLTADYFYHAPGPVTEVPPSVGSGSAEQQVFVQDTQPSEAGPWAWFKPLSGGEFELYVEDGS